jgi:hypothetical protein
MFTVRPFPQPEARAEMEILNHHLKFWPGKREGSVIVFLTELLSDSR